MRGRHRSAASRQLWLGLHGPLTGEGVRQMLLARIAEAGIPNVHPHQFRHTAAHRWLPRAARNRILPGSPGGPRVRPCWAATAHQQPKNELEHRTAALRPGIRCDPWPLQDSRHGPSSRPTTDSELSARNAELGGGSGRTPQPCSRSTRRFLGGTDQPRPGRALTSSTISSTRQSSRRLRPMRLITGWRRVENVAHVGGGTLSHNAVTGALLVVALWSRWYGPSIRGMISKYQ